MKKYGIITAMKEEADLIIEKYNLKLEASTQNISFFVNDSTVLCLCWIGKIQASMWTTLMIERYSPENCINIWIAGNGNAKKINIGDVILVGKVIQHDLHLPFEWEHLDYVKKEIIIPGHTMSKIEWSFSVHIEWICVTGDQFIDDKNKVITLHEKHKADCIEMEAFAFLSVARELSQLNKCTVIKWISDWADNSAINDHMSNLEVAMNHSIKVLDNIMETWK